MVARTITVNDRMQKGYRYRLTAPVGRGFDPEFNPELTRSPLPATPAASASPLGVRQQKDLISAPLTLPLPMPPIAGKFCNENQR